MLHQAPNDPVLVRQEQHAKEHYTKILSSSLALIRQQCKLDWLKFGDDSTRFFYAQAKCRKLATYVYSLQSTTGTTLEGFDQVGREMLQYYKQLLGQESMVAPSQIETSLANQGPRLTPEQQVALCRPFTPADIKEALFSIPNHKSPGPDGYSSGFFKHTWQHTGALLCDLVDGFFRTGSLPHQVSATKLVLLPKKDYPQTATDFRPISCCNVLYKIIAKLLSWRMKEVLPSIIDPCQGAFVPGRELLYNVLICQDLARGYQRRHITPRCMLKVDLRKAFDSVHWTFLQQWLWALKFPQVYISWIMTCITTVSFQIHLNGRTHTPFQGKRGLKQGDPLSPLLFVITMEYFSRLLKTECAHKDFKYHPSCTRLQLSHLMFADDLLLFSKADVASLTHIKNALSKFAATAGLEANLQKSQLILGGCPPELQEACRQTIQFEDSHFPIRYLGVPITSGRLTKIECSNLVDKIMARIRVWATRNLSFAGRAALINGVIFGLFNYWASILLLPQAVLSKITVACRNYLWGGFDTYTRVPHISWSNSCHSKQYGGLGIKDFEAWNKAIIAKLVWAVAQKKEVLWVKWVHGRYIKQADWGTFTPAPDSSWTWKKICSIKELFRKGCTPHSSWDFLGQPKYTVKSGYSWLKGGEKVPWANLVWSRVSLPRHAFVTWVAIQHRLPTKDQLSRFVQQLDKQCNLCRNAEEDAPHLFQHCTYAREVWSAISHWWPHQNLATLPMSPRLRSKSPFQRISYAIYAPAIYHIWHARNQSIFKQHHISSDHTARQIREQIQQRVLFLNTISPAYRQCLDIVLA